MFRVRVIAAAGALALAGCSGSSSSMPDWLKFKPPPPPLQALQFESEPPGAEVRTAQGQSCRTPCSLAVPFAPQSVTFSLNGFLPQTVPVQVVQTGERSEETFQAPPPKFDPNPVEVALEAAAPPPKSAPPKKQRKITPKPKTAANPVQQGSVQPTPAPDAQLSPAPPPPGQPVASSPFPPPPTFQPSAR
jgi:hypothetical protein